jgi:hypothetical protein
MRKPAEREDGWQDDGRGDGRYGVEHYLYLPAMRSVIAGAPPRAGERKVPGQESYLISPNTDSFGSRGQ